MESRYMTTSTTCTSASPRRNRGSSNGAGEPLDGAGPQHRVPGPRRSESVESYRWETRAIAGIALLAVVAGVVSDVFAGHFWGRHVLLTGLASSVIVVMVSVALVTEVVERRRRRRWRVLAQYVMLELVQSARLVWTGLMELAGLMPSDAYTTTSIDAGARAVRDTPRLAEAIRALVGDGDRRRLLHEEIDRFAKHTDDVLGRWAAVMLNGAVYADVIDRHVELAADVAGLDSLLDYFEPTDDDRGRRREGRSNAAIQFTGEFDDDWLADRVVAMTQLAEELDRGTLVLALRIVPIEWWAARLGDTRLASTARLAAYAEVERCNAPRRHTHGARCVDSDGVSAQAENLWPTLAAGRCPSKESERGGHGGD
jgi:hypothetical protein